MIYRFSLYFLFTFSGNGAQIKQYLQNLQSEWVQQSETQWLNRKKLSDFGP